ncbi:MAG: gp53-like domain-containing protein [Symbiopectobacterium sp.]|uniref:gp53-like domain-containing protein n=1 Tax=Symbiopectobacterium sp. TaxID=2952789 RepID=UPI0039EA4C08
MTPQNLGFGESLLSENGFQPLPGGFLMQWGVVNENNTGTFPIPFPNKCFVINATLCQNGAPWDGSVTSAYILDNRQFKAACGQLTGNLIYWTAIGY